jgi:hypothetical protein
MSFLPTKLRPATDREELDMAWKIVPLELRNRFFDYAKIIKPGDPDHMLNDILMGLAVTLDYEIQMHGIIEFYRGEGSYRALSVGDSYIEAVLRRSAGNVSSIWVRFGDSRPNNKTTFHNKTIFLCNGTSNIDAAQNAIDILFKIAVLRERVYLALDRVEVL